MPAKTEAYELRAQAFEQLEKLCLLLNEALDNGVKIEFNLAQGPDGKFTIARFDAWEKIKAN